MMRLFRRYVLGGKSDKTEGTLLAFLIGVAWVTWIIWHTSRGADMTPVIGLASTYMVTTVAAFTGATVVHHLRPKADRPSGLDDGFNGDPVEPQQEKQP